MNDKKLLRTGLAGSIIAAICCFTPALVVLVGFVGLSAIIGWLDYGLFPLLFASMGLDMRRRRRATISPTPAATLVPMHGAPKTAPQPQPWTAWRHNQSPTTTQPPKHAAHVFEADMAGIFDPDVRLRAACHLCMRARD